MVREGRVTALPGVGKTLEEKLTALLETGSIPAAEKLRAKFPPGVVAMTRLDGVGPKSARRLYEELGVDSLDALRAAATEGRVRELKGFGPKAETAILASLEAHDERPAGDARGAAGSAGGRRADRRRRCARSPRSCAPRSPARRGAWATASRTSTWSWRRDDPAAVVAAFTALEVIGSSARGGDNGARGVTQNGIAVDLRIVTPATFGNLLQHFTGSKAHNVAPARARGAARAARERARHPRRRDRRDHALRDRGGGLRAPRPHVRGARAARGPRRARARAGSRRELDHGRRPARRPALPHRRERRARHDRGDGARRARAGPRVPRDHRPLGEPRLRQPRHARRAAAAHRRGAPRSTSGSTASACSPAARSTSCPTARSTTTTRSSSSSTGSSPASHTSFRMAGDAMTARIVRAIEHPLVDVIGHPTGRLIEQRAGPTTWTSAR